MASAEGGMCRLAAGSSATAAKPVVALCRITDIPYGGTISHPGKYEITATNRRCK
jgi:hypothetical protein